MAAIAAAAARFLSACDMGETGVAGTAPDFVGAVALTGQATAGVA